MAYSAGGEPRLALRRIRVLCFAFDHGYGVPPTPAAIQLSDNPFLCWIDSRGHTARVGIGWNRRRNRGGLSWPEAYDDLCHPGLLDCDRVHGVCLVLAIVRAAAFRRWAGARIRMGNGNRDGGGTVARKASWQGSRPDAMRVGYRLFSCFRRLVCCQYVGPFGMVVDVYHRRAARVGDALDPPRH